VPDRPSTILSFFVTLFLFLGGGAAGAGLAHWCAPNSGLAAGLGFLMLPLSMFCGFWAWLGAALISGLWSLLRRGCRANPRRTGLHALPRGTFAFLPTTLLIVLPVAVVTGFVSERFSFVSTVAIYLATGAAYGTAMWRAAKSGLLPFPEDV
jgi:hypothetical protein